MPRGPCVSQKTVEDSELRREIRYEYFCREIKGVVSFISTREEEKGVVISVVDTDVDVWSPRGVRHIQSVSTHSQFENGASQVDREFEESFTRDGVLCFVLPTKSLRPLTAAVADRKCHSLLLRKWFYKTSRWGQENKKGFLRSPFYVELKGFLTRPLQGTCNRKDLLRNA
ncbi:hypothetical protein EZJ49_03995 [Bdellovibrio bacteriovorus]|uniref:hypothetical protein n=1 Tax=Bdellovibrio bacteriovorus TaxID=959 RepID=UPI0021D13D07|nr:hypothetical protein [Bdellovibrio bacteriovorus]UXR65413.1 hypothetical protein EZJ49_03995 [Bdellovibrio bacteriovorus]